MSEFAGGQVTIAEISIVLDGAVALVYDRRGYL